MLLWDGLDIFPTFSSIATYAYCIYIGVSDFPTRSVLSITVFLLREGGYLVVYAFITILLKRRGR